MRISKKVFIGIFIITLGFCIFILNTFLSISIGKSSEKHVFIEEAEHYLEEKYGRSVEIIEYLSDYDGAPAVKAFFEDEPDVVFISYHDSDFYLITYLEKEAEDKLSMYFPNFRISTHLDWVPFAECENRLIEFYKKNNRPISWNDVECVEKLSRIIIRSTEEFTQLEANLCAYRILEIFDGCVSGAFNLHLCGEESQYVYKLSPDGELKLV